MADTRVTQVLSTFGAVAFPGVYDTLSARIAERVGFPMAFVSGYSVAATSIGEPDMGLLTQTEMIDRARRICMSVKIPIIVDADTGYGNALNVERAVRLLERAGANAIQLEDQDFPKRCGHLDDKTLIPAQEMAGKIKAAVDVRASSETLIIARTDAIAVEGFDGAVARAALYRDAGADMLFIEAPRQRDELARVVKQAAGKVPLMANMVEGGKTPILPARELQELGFSLVIFPGGIVRALAKTAEEFYGSLKAHGTTDPFLPRMFDFAALNDLIGTTELMALGKQYEAVPAPDSNKGRRI